MSPEFELPIALYMVVMTAFALVLIATTTRRSGLWVSGMAAVLAAVLASNLRDVIRLTVREFAAAKMECSAVTTGSTVGRESSRSTVGTKQGDK